MQLENTKLTLIRLKKRHGSYVKGMPKDLKPDYSEKGLQPGYSYKGYDDKDRDFIYYKTRELDDLFHDSDSVINFDIDNVFITEKKAVEELIFTKKYVAEVLQELKAIEIRNTGRTYSKYPLTCCYNMFNITNEILEEILESEEMLNFLSPNKFQSLNEENLKLKFENHWRTKKMKYIVHLIAFIPFLAGCFYVILSKDDETIIGTSKIIIICIAGVLTILFNIFFNNHNSFKDSFKLIFTNSRKKLKEKEWETFKK